MERLERDGKVKVEFRPHRTSESCLTTQERIISEKKLIRNYNPGICEHHHYHELKKLPSDFVAVGDALGHVNPRYGQGINKVRVILVEVDKILH